MVTRNLRIRIMCVHVKYPKLCGQGKLATLVDYNLGKVAIMESVSILYSAQHLL